MRRIQISTEFEAVYMINGVFYESLPPFEVDESALDYLSVFPLKASLLPYTIKLLGGIPQNNRDLAIAYLLPKDFGEITLKPRFNYVYSPQGVALRTAGADISKNLAIRFFWHIKKGELANARQFLSEQLNDVLDDKALGEFFEAYIDAIPNRYYPEFGECIILIDRNNLGHIFDVIYKNGLIDNLSESEV